MILILKEANKTMTLEESTKALIGQAERTTAAVQEHVRRAASALGRGLAPDSAAVNALGVFLEPRLRENDLLEARAEIDAALERMRNATWPGHSDYRVCGLS